MTNVSQIRTERLRVVDNEMESVRTCKLHRAVTIRRGDTRIEVYINRDRSQHGYYGSAEFNSKGLSSWGKLPSDAVAKIIAEIEAEIGKEV